jgi:Pentapeptide repeats (8 copies)
MDIQKLREQYKQGKRNFINKNLVGIDLSSTCLDWIDLSGSNLMGAKLNNAEFLEANLTEVSLIATSAMKSNFKGANFSKADLSGAAFIDSNLVEANFNEAILIRINLSMSNLVRETLPGGWLRIDFRTLSFGEIRKISARWTASGRARFVVMRPDGRGGYEVLYRTPIFPVSAGIMETKVPRWWVLEGDRLAVWTDSNCLGSQSADAGSTHHLAIKLQGDPTIPDVSPNRTISDARKLAVWTS